MPSAVDVVKTRIQIDPELSRHSLLSGGRKIVASEGPTVCVIIILPDQSGLRRPFTGLSVGPPHWFWTHSRRVSSTGWSQIRWL